MGVLATIAFFAYVPALALLWYFYHKDRYEPEPKRYVIATFILGATLSVSIAYFLESVLTIGGLIKPILPTTAFYVALVAGIVEEPAKALAVVYPFRRGQMDGIMDGIVYGVAAGLGFAATENFLYGLGWGVAVTITRAFLTPLAHATWTAIIGVGYGLIAEGKPAALGSFYSLAITLHFFWDYFAFLSATVPAYNAVLIFLLLLNLVILRYFLLLGEMEERRRFARYFIRGGYP
jgi:RsiW-degrading membrane proteinase PrsW (M82 family)